MMAPQWIILMCAGLVPVLLIAVEALRSTRSDSNALGQALAASDARMKARFLALPRRWYHYLATGAILTMPFAQWFGYLYSHDLRAVLLPLGLVCVLNIWIGMNSPASIDLKPTPAREQLMTIGVMGVLLLMAFAMPTTTGTLIWRGIAIDMLGLAVTTFVARKYPPTILARDARGQRMAP